MLIRRTPDEQGSFSLGHVSLAHQFPDGPILPDGPGVGQKLIGSNSASICFCALLFASDCLDAEPGGNSISVN